MLNIILKSDFQSLMKTLNIISNINKNAEIINLNLSLLSKHYYRFKITSLITELINKKNIINKEILEQHKGTGFFCIIDFDKDKKMHYLITNNHLIDDNYIKENKWINITLNDDSEGKVIIIDENREFHCYEEYDTTIIEILPEIDGITDFLKLDEELCDEQIENYYKKNPFI